MAVANLEAALEVEVISWRMGACETMAAEVDVGVGTGAEAGRAGGAEFAEENGKNFVSDNDSKRRWDFQMNCILICFCS